MSLEHSQLQDLITGKIPVLWICSIREDARQRLKCSSGAVYLSSASANHILTKHSDISTFDLLLLPVAITKGELFLDKNIASFIGSIYTTEDKRTYFTPMKIAQSGHEIWVSSMHRQQQRQIEQKKKKLMPLSFS